MAETPLDSRVTNGRFVGPGAPAVGSLTIHNGKVVDEPNAEVWRTVNASGHIVFPGLIQPGATAAEDVLDIVRGGVTTAIAMNPAGSRACLDYTTAVPAGLQVIEASDAAALVERDWELLLGDEPVHFQAAPDSDLPVIHFLYHEGHRQRSMTLERIAAVTSGNFARAAGIFPRKGSFEVEADGDLFVFDPDADDPYSDIGWPGRVIFSLVRGSILLYNGQIHTSAGDGKLII